MRRTYQVTALQHVGDLAKNSRWTAEGTNVDSYEDVGHMIELVPAYALRRFSKNSSSWSFEIRVNLRPLDSSSSLLSLSRYYT